LPFAPSQRQQLDGDAAHFTAGWGFRLPSHKEQQQEQQTMQQEREQEGTGKKPIPWDPHIEHTTFG
jgi:hypothetical protein